MGHSSSNPASLEFQFRPDSSRMPLWGAAHCENWKRDHRGYLDHFGGSTPGTLRLSSDGATAARFSKLEAGERKLQERIAAHKKAEEQEEEERLLNEAQEAAKQLEEKKQNKEKKAAVVHSKEIEKNEPHYQD